MIAAENSDPNSFVLLQVGERRRLGLPTEHTSLTEWEWGEGHWRLVRYNDAAHLGDAQAVLFQDGLAFQGDDLLIDLVPKLVVDVAVAERHFKQGDIHDDQIDALRSGDLVGCFGPIRHGFRGRLGCR